MAAKPMTADEVMKHPEYPHVTWPLKPAKEGLLPVAAGRGGPFDLAFELHGRGPVRLVWIMGLGAFMTAWQRQTKDFAHTQSSKYTSLLFDNRGMGKSGKPLMRYSTSEMAKDLVELLDHVGWTEKRSVNVVGISMGGMIAQELGLLIPERISTLSLISTAPYLFRTIGYFENLRNRINLFFPRPLNIQIENTKSNMFTQSWLSKPDEAEYTVEPFPTNSDRCTANELHKRLDNPNRLSTVGFVMQTIAAGWHHKSASQLSSLADSIGRNRIMVVHGTLDKMLTFPHAEVLLEGLGGEKGEVETHFIEGQGHVIPIEMRKEFNGWCEELWARGERLNAEKVAEGTTTGSSET